MKNKDHLNSHQSLSDDYWKCLPLTPTFNGNQKHRCNGTYLYYHWFPSLFFTMYALSLCWSTTISAFGICLLGCQIGNDKSYQRQSVNAFSRFDPAVVHRFSQTWHGLTGIWFRYNVSPIVSLLARIAQVSPIIVEVHRRCKIHWTVTSV